MEKIEEMSGGITFEMRGLKKFSLVFCKNILNRRINSIDSYIENTYIVGVYN